MRARVEKVDVLGWNKSLWTNVSEEEKREHHLHVISSPIKRSKKETNHFTIPQAKSIIIIAASLKSN